MTGNQAKRLLCHGLSIGFFLLVPTLTPSQVSPTSIQGLRSVSAAPPPAYQVTLAQLGYDARILNSHGASTEYIFRLPAGWELLAGSVLELDFSYIFNRIGLSGGQSPLSLYGDFTVAIDGQDSHVFSIEAATLEHTRLRVDLPLDVLNDPARITHSIKISLDDSSLCNVLHDVRLTIHPTSLLSLVYNPLPIVADLALYPRPFYQRAFEPDQVRFVLPTRPTETDLNGAVAVAARLGSLTYRMVISGTTDQDLLGRLDVKDIPHEHLIVVGTPETNGLILRLNDLDVLPLPLRERQLDLSSIGPLAVTPGDSLTYTLTLTNTTSQDLSALSLVDTLPADAQVMTCSLACSETVKGKVRWLIPSLGPNETSSFTLGLRLNDAITNSIVENTAVLLDAESGPLNISTLTTTVSSTRESESGTQVSASTHSRYLFLQGTQAVSENDGVVQELVAPWDQTRAILVITGLSDQAVYKASQAMSLNSYLPGMKGPWTLVRDVRPVSNPQPRPQTADITFAALGNEDKILRGYSAETNYYLNIPVGWRLTEDAYLDLRFSHSANLLQSSSSLSVLFNNKPIAEVGLSDGTRLNGELKVKLPASQVRFGLNNSISVQTQLRPLDACTNPDMWLLVSSGSLLHLDHKEQSTQLLDLGLYPYPLDQRPDLADVLFVLPPEPAPEEWEDALQLAAALGSFTDGSRLAPATLLGDLGPKDKLSNYHLIAIGRPSRNTLLQQVNAQLPQPFLPHSDLIEQKLDQVTLRLPPDMSLGYIQLIASPWNEARALLAVTGTTEKGVKEAMNTLTQESWKLKGNLALIGNGTVNTIDTRGLTKTGTAMAVATAVPQMSPVPASTDLSTPLPPSPTASAPGLKQAPLTPDRPAWLMPLVVAAGLVILIILAIAFWQARRGKL